jgi:hypothetical protein
MGPSNLAVKTFPKSLKARYSLDSSIGNDMILSENQVKDPLLYFGVLLPSCFKKAQSSFHCTLKSIVGSANLLMRINQLYQECLDFQHRTDVY